MQPPFYFDDRDPSRYLIKDDYIYKEMASYDELKFQNECLINEKKQLIRENKELKQKIESYYQSMRSVKRISEEFVDD